MRRASSPLVGARVRGGGAQYVPGVGHGVTIGILIEYAPAFRRWGELIDAGGIAIQTEKARDFVTGEILLPDNLDETFRRSQHFSDKGGEIQQGF